MLTLDFINTVAFAGLVLFAGHGVRSAAPLLARYNVPAPVIGGLLVAAVVAAARIAGVSLVTFDTRMQTPLMIAFFTTIGFGASLSLLRGEQAHLGDCGRCGKGARAVVFRIARAFVATILL